MGTETIPTPHGEMYVQTLVINGTNTTEWQHIEQLSPIPPLC